MQHLYYSSVGRRQPLQIGRGILEPAQPFHHLPAWQNGGKILSCADGVAKALEWYVNYRAQVPQISTVSASKWSEGANQTHVEEVEAYVDTQKSLAVNARGACPDCGGVVEHVEGCITCRGCGYTECG